MKNYFFILLLFCLNIEANDIKLSKYDKKKHLEFCDLKCCLTEDENKYLDESNRTITLCVQTDLFPIDDFIDGKHTGMMSDIMKQISEKADIKFEFIPTKSFLDVKNKIKNKECQVLTIINTKQKKIPSLYVTKAVINTHFTLISKLDKSFIQKATQLENKKLIVQFQIYKDYILKFHPTLNIEVQNDSAIMMKSLLNDDVFAVLSIDEKADYLIDEYGYSKLKINGFLLRNIGIAGGIGIQKDELILINIFEKALESISDKEIELVIESWRKNRYSEHVNYEIIFEILFIVFIVLSIMYYYQRKLKFFNKKLAKQVNHKTKALKELNESLENSVAQKVEELREKDKILTMQSKQAVMGEMISMIAHQWRQPLNTITLQISKYQLDEIINTTNEKNQDIDDVFDKINETIMFLSDTIDDFQTYFRLDKESTEIEADDLLNKAVSFVKSRIIHNKIIIDIKTNKNIVLNVYVNELLHVILNILNNAIDSYDGVDRDEKIIKIYTTQTDDRVSIYIEDNGCGIPNENLNKLFEPYFSTKGKNGSGLGLYMSQMIIQKQFDGNIVISSSDEGSIFKIDILKSVYEPPSP